MTNVVVCPSPGSEHCDGTIVAASCGCGDAATGFFSASARFFNRLQHLAFTWLVLLQKKHFFRSSFFSLLDDSFLTSLALSLPFALDVIAFGFFLRIRSLIVDVLLCSHDLENLHLVPACDSDVVRMRCSFTRVSSIHNTVTPLLMSSLTVFVGFSQSCVVLSNAASQHVHQEESHTLPKFGGVTCLGPSPTQAEGR